MTEITQRNREIETRSFADILAMPEDERPSVISGILKRREGLLITGPSGIGKSILIQNLALSLASGTPFLGRYSIEARNRVLILQSENDYSIFRERLDGMVHDWSGEREEALTRIFLPWNHDSPQISGSISGKLGGATEFLDEIKTLIERVQADVVIWDPLISFHAGDENDNSAMRKSLDLLTGLANECDITNVMVHHHGKSEHAGMLKSRGATAITDWASTVLTLTWKKLRNPRREDWARHIFKCEWTKLRGFPRQERLILEMMDGFEFRIFEDGHQSVEVSSEEIATVLENAGGHIEGYYPFIQLIREGCNVGDNQARRFLTHAIEMGEVIKEENPADSRRKVYRLPRHGERMRDQL